MGIFLYVIVHKIVLPMIPKLAYWEFIPMLTSPRPYYMQSLSCVQTMKLCFTVFHGIDSD